jgi:hypothetical protein
VSIDDRTYEAIDPDQRHDGLYSRSPGEVGHWVSPALFPPAPERELIATLVGEGVLPWASWLLSLLPSLAEMAARLEQDLNPDPTARRRFARTVVQFESHFDLVPNLGVAQRNLRLELRETADPGRQLLAISSRARYGHGHHQPWVPLDPKIVDPARIEAERGWGRNDDPTWAALRRLLAEGFGPQFCQMLQFPSPVTVAPALAPVSRSA